jgi:hypothetical protein
MAATSSRKTSISGWSSMRAVMALANASRSTASASPAGTANSRAVGITSEPSRSISHFSCPDGVVGSIDLNELEQTSSASQPVLWAGVLRLGRIS